MPSIRAKIRDKKTKLAKPPKPVEDHPALFGNFEEGSFCKVPVDVIKRNPDQPRKIFNEESLSELANSIKQKGVLQPVIIKSDMGINIYLVAGERRLRAARLAGVKEIPAIVTKGNPAEIALIENVQREDLNPIEEAEAYERLMQQENYTQEKLALIVGKARTTITEILTLNKLPDDIRDECRTSDNYPKSVLLEVAKQKTPDDMKNLYRIIKEGALKTRQVRKIARTPSKKRTPAAITVDRARKLYHSLEKFDWETINPKEKIEMISVLENLNKVLNQLLNK